MRSWSYGQIRVLYKTPWQFISPIAGLPTITTPPKDTSPGKPVSFTVQATGAEPLSFQWQWKPIGKKDGNEEWQNLSCSGSIQGADTPVLTFSSSDSCREGLYRCTVTNCAGTVESICADHIVGELACPCIPKV